MKVIFPIYCFGRAGGERVISKLANELIKNGNEVCFVVPQGRNVPYYPTDAKIVTSKTVTGFGRKGNAILNYLHLVIKSRSQKADIAIATFNLTAYIVAFLSFSTKKYYYIQAYEPVFFESHFRKFLAYLTYLLPLKKIVNHDGLLPEKLNRYVAVVPAGIDDTIFNARNTSRHNGKINIGLVGRQEERKGTKELISALIAWHNISNTIVNVAVYLSDEDRARLCQANVVFNFFPIESDEKLAEFYKLNDIMLATGLVEDGAFHYPCAESMASGCVVISNYAPLFNTSSKFRIDTYNQEKIINKLDLYVNSDVLTLSEEIDANLAAVKSISWRNVGRKLNAALQIP